MSRVHTRHLIEEGRVFMSLGIGLNGDPAGRERYFLSAAGKFVQAIEELEHTLEHEIDDIRRTMNAEAARR